MPSEDQDQADNERAINECGTPADAPTPAPTGDIADYRKEFLRATREELVRADAKAALLLAAAGIAVGALLNGLLNGRWSPNDLTNEVEWVWWLGASAVALAVVALGTAVYPQTRRVGRAPTKAAYYGDVVQLERDELDAALRGAAADLAESVVDQIYQVSTIVARKYARIRFALAAFAGGAALCTLAILLNLLLTSGHR